MSGDILGGMVAGLERNRSALEATLEQFIPSPLVWERSIKRGNYRSIDGQFIITGHGNYFRVSQLKATGRWLTLGGPGYRTLASAKAAAEAAR